MNFLRLKNILKFFTFCILFFGLIWCTSYLFVWANDGFSLANISTKFNYPEHRSTAPLLPKEIDEIREILSQKFVYLGKGAQNFAFLSEDEEWVIKFVKQKHFHLPVGEEMALSFPFLDSYRETRLKKKHETAKNYFTCCKLAYEQLKNETAIKYYHMTKTDYLQTKVQVKDKLGFKHVIDLDQVEFILQRRAEHIIPLLAHLSQTQDDQQFQTTLEKLMQVFVMLSKKGIKDFDRRIFQNYGFIDGEVIIIDIGQLKKDSEVESIEGLKEELQKRGAQILAWITKSYPKQAEPFEKKLVALLR